MKRPQWWEWLVLLVVVGTIYAMWAPVFTQAKPGSRLACVSRAKMQGLALVMYCEDYDGNAPPATQWVDAAYPYTTNFSGVFQCSELRKDEFGYAFNSLLSRKQLETLTNANGTAVTFESENLVKNAYNSGKGFATRHHDQGYVVFADGHVKLLEVQAFTALPAPAWQENEAEGTKGSAKEPK